MKLTTIFTTAAVMLLSVSTALAADLSGNKTKRALQLPTLTREQRNALVANTATTTSSQPRRAPLATAALDEPELLLEEDFALMAAGSEEEPDATMLPEDYFDTGNQFLPDGYTHTSGWWGCGIYQAGGSCFLGYPGYGGVITTPNLNLNGKIRVSFKMKPGANIKKNAMLIVNIAYGDQYNPIYYDAKTLKLAAGEPWTDYTLDFECDYTGDDAYVQFNGMLNDNGKFIDDIKIERVGYILSKPIASQPTDYTGDAFTALWNEQGAATGYLLTAYSAEVIGEASVVEDDFNSASLPSFIDGSTGITIEDLPNATDDKALKITPTTPLIISTPNKMINGLKFSSFCYDPSGMGLPEGEIKLYGYLKGSWVEAPVSKQLSGLSEKPDAYWLFSDDDLVIIDKYDKIKLESDVDAYIDDMSLSLDAEMKYDYVAEDLPVSGSSYYLENLNPERDYFFYVMATDGENTTAPSNIVKIYQLLPPVAKEASDIDPRGGFTANWESSPKAESYLVTVYDAVAVEEDEENRVILSETFSKAHVSDEGYTMDAPYYLGNDYNPETLDEYTDNAGWMGIVTTVYDNMLGCDWDYMGMSILSSPCFDASNNGGVFTVEFDCYAPMGDMMTLQNSAISVERIAITPGLNHYSQTFSNGFMQSYVCFYTTYGYPFLVSNVKVTQNVSKGDIIRTLVAQSEATADNSYYFPELKKQEDKLLLYSVKAQYEREGVTYISADSNEMLVQIESAIENISADATADTMIYDILGRPMGRSLENLPNGFYIQNKKVIKK